MIRTVELSIKDHFNELYVAAHDARNKWEDLGFALGIPKDILPSIKLDNPSNIGGCFRAMLTKWFDRQPCYLDNFLRALCSEIIEEKGVCEKVRETFPSKLDLLVFVISCNILQ